jgi:hypothetical protein
MTNYYVEVTDNKTNEEFLLEMKNSTQEDINSYCKTNNYKVNKIANTNNSHICKYCKGIAEGKEKDLLCKECRETFGHYLYSEL